MAVIENWLIGTDNMVKVTGLKDVLSDTYINNATVSGVLKDASGNAVTNADSISFEYQDGTDGDYMGNIPDDADITDGTEYTLEVTAVHGSYQLFTKVTREATYKTA